MKLSSDSVFYNHSDSNTNDDEVIVSGYVNNTVGNVGYLGNKSPYIVIVQSGWVGYGDTIDYKKFSLMNDTNVTFGISATDAVQFTIYELTTKTSSKKTTYSLKKMKSVTPKYNGAGDYVADNISITLKAGTNYYFSVKSTNASKGGNAEYYVFLPSVSSTSIKAALSMPEASATPDAWSVSSSVAEPAALSMPEAAADLDAWNASSSAVQDDLLAGLTDFNAGNELASANLSVADRLQAEDGGTLQQLSGFLA